MMKSAVNKHSLGLTFIICTYNRSSYLTDTIQSLKKCLFGNAKVEILVVDNNSKDDTAQVVARHQEDNDNANLTITYLPEKQQGLSFARNAGITAAKYEAIVFIDDDIRASQNFIIAWEEFFGNYPEALAAGSKIKVQFDDGKPSWISHFILSLFGHHNLGHKIRNYPPGKYPFGGNMAFRKQVFDLTGYFNVNLGRIGKNMAANEEKELFRRVRSHNLPVYYIPDALLYHRINKERTTVGFIKKQAEGLGRSYKTEVNDGVVSKTSFYFQQLYKGLVTLFLLLTYSIALTPAKGVMLLKFRIWILKGFHSS